ncbi:MAG: MFS transporter [Alphaproteobacteria bacterium]|nr:MFS transporter [Alphaproteobacteria bacterium]
MSDPEEYRHAPPENPAGALSARAAALDIIESVLRRKHELDLALETAEAFTSLPARDRAFARMLATTTLRRLGQIDDLLRRAQTRPDNAMPAAVQNVLRIGVCQLLFMEVPDHAAVDTSVRLAERAELSRLKGLVNGILRTMTREGREWAGKQDETRLNTPHWLMEQWILDYGLRTAAEVAQASLAEAPLDITVKNPGMIEYWANELEAAILPTGSLRRASGGRVTDLPGFDDGMWWIQDAAAALPARLLGDVNGKDVLDLCAAPGGKTAQLAAMGANVTALDRSIKRLQRLEENMKRLRLGEHVRTEAADASVWRPREPAPFILLDAPCTATGTIRRNPDILHLKSKSDMDRLVSLQGNLLANAATMLAPGGTLIYCTCSLQKAEGEALVEQFLAESPGFVRKPITQQEAPIEGAITPEGDLRLFPFHMAAHGGMDGFYVARLRRSS